MVEGLGNARVILPKGTKITIYGALYSSKSQRNLLSFENLRKKGYHVETKNENNKLGVHISQKM